MTRARAFALLTGFAVGFLVATLLHNYPKDQVTRHRYCRVCGEYEETYNEGVIMGSRREHRSLAGGPLHRLLERSVGEHEHEFTDWATIFPTFGVPDEHPEVGSLVQRIRALEDDPTLISALEQAMRHDPERTTQLAQRLIDPARAVPVGALLPLARHEQSWDERWAAVDVALARGR